MTARPAFLALVAHWRRHPGQLAALLIGLALATALWTAVQAINTEARAGYDRAARAFGTQNRPLLVPVAGQNLPLADYIALRRAGWQVAPVIEGKLRAGGQNVTLIGLDPLTAPAVPAPQNAPGSRDPAAALAAFIGPPGELRGHPETLALLVPLQLAPTPVPSPDLSPGTVVTDIGTAAALLGVQDRLSRLVLLAPPAPDLPPLAIIAPGLREVAPGGDTDIEGLTGSFHMNLTAFGFLSFAVGLFIVHGGIGLAFEQRRPALRTLRALGVPLKVLGRLLLAEALALALVAGLAGVGLGYVLAAALLPDVAATLRGLYGAPVAGSLAVRPGWWAAGMAMAAGGTLLAASGSFWQLARLPLLAPAMPRAWAMAGDRRSRLLGSCGLGLLGLAAAAGFGHGLWAAFLALGGLLLGAALSLPWLLGRLLRLAEARARGPVAQWFWADTRQQVPGLSLALMALLIALAANIGVSTMVASFRATFEGWLDRRLAADLYLRADDAAGAAALLPLLTARAEAVLPMPRVEAHLGGAPGTVWGMADHDLYRQRWPIIAALPDVWDRLAAGRGMLVNEQWAIRAGIAPGQMAALDDRSIEVLGIYADYGNPRPQAILGIGAFTARYPDAPALQVALRLAPGSAAALSADLVAKGALRPDQIALPETIKAESRAVFERTFAATDALSVLTLGVAAVAILTSLLTLQSLRLPQVAPLWALGLSRGRIAGLELLRAGLLGAGVAAAAVPVGLALAWLLLARVNVAAFGWRLPMQAFPGDWAILGAAAVAAALLAAALPAARLARMRPADLLRVFANAR